jgi:transposase, IS30 family
MSHKHLTRDDRLELGALFRAGHSDKEIGDHIGKHRTTVWREKKNNGTDNKSGYHAGVANRKAKERRHDANQRFRKILPGTRLYDYCEKALKRGYSPEQISGRLKAVLGEAVVKHDTIYAWVYTERPDLKPYLRRGCDKYRRRHGTKDRIEVRKQSEKRSIHDRPAVVDERSRVGDWEGDTVRGVKNSGYIATLVERKSGYLLARKLKRATGEAMLTESARALRKIPRQKRLTLTLDNGTEMSEHEELERRTAMIVYFADAYHSCQRGTNENTNGLLRQYFPKKSSFTDVRQRDIDRAVSLINTRPRKRHGYLSPHTVFHERVAIRSGM